MSQKTYWKGIDELNETPEFLDKKETEFVGTDLSPIDLVEKAVKYTPHARRDFLKMMGFSLAAATVAASCEMPVRKAIPYVVKPDEIIPGKANYYATTFADGSDYCSILVKTREGRPIKIEGNTKSSITKGGTNARVQGSILSLYDMARLQQPYAQGKATIWEEIDTAITSQLNSIAASGGAIRILSSSIISPSTKKIIADLGTKYTNLKHITRDAISYSGMINANEKSFGIKGIPSYKFDKAEVIVSIGADFLGTWLSPIEFSKDYSKTRKVSLAQPKMSKMIAIESMMSLTGSNADDRIVVRPSEMGAVVAAISNKLGGPGALNVSESISAELDKVVAALKTAQGKALVVCGVNDTNIQVLVNSINASIGAIGNTISFERTCNIKQGNDADFNALVHELKNGSVQGLFIINSNPVYDAPNGAELADLISKVSLSVCFNEYMDETNKVCKYATPTHHFLESWSDAEPYTGKYSLSQPTIVNIFKTRQYQDSLLKWTGSNSDYYTLIKNYWSNITPGVQWQLALSDGTYEVAANAINTKFNGDAATAAAAIPSPSKDDIDVVLYEKVMIGDGKYANNPWLQEHPDPITKTVWDNYILVSPAYAKSLKIGQNPESDVDYHREIAKVTANNITVELPVLVQPGLSDNTIAIALGYGRTHGGTVANGKGKNVFNMAVLGADAVNYNLSGARVSLVEGTYVVVQTQTHHTLKVEDETIKRTVVREGTLKNLARDVKNLQTERHNYMATLDESLYPKITYNNLKWGLSIDLNSCTGCGACAIACQSENNVAVVGKDEVRRIHEMHWLRIDRYYQGDINNPKVVHQPVMCQHCDNAPCENVCPVNATNHSTEGLNQMAYNRCIGTRYCANNCPYKVRRFNWLDWFDADSFPANRPEFYITNETKTFDESLTRMVLNPDVTVRSRGVIEKCSFCVQRIQEAKLKAKVENRMLVDGDVKSACQTACPTDAIVFGNVNDENSEVHKRLNDELTYLMLEEINVRPAVSYSMKVRNIAEELYPYEAVKPIDHAPFQSDVSHENHGHKSDDTHSKRAHPNGH